MRGRATFDPWTCDVGFGAAEHVVVVVATKERVSDEEMARVRRRRRKDEDVGVDRKDRGTSGAVSSTTSPT